MTKINTHQMSNDFDDVCDSSIEPSLQNPDSQNFPTPAGGNAEAGSAPPKPFGIGGGLTVLAIFFVWQPFPAFVSIAASIDQIFNEIGYIPNHIARDIAIVYSLDSASILIAKALLYTAGLIILKGSKKGRKTANISLLSAALLSTIPLFSVQLLPLKIQNDLHGFLIGGVIGAILWCIIFGLYLNLSKRCKNTYETDYPIPPAKSWLWTGYKILLGGILALSLVMAVIGAIKIREATACGGVTAAVFFEGDWGNHNLR